MVKKIITRQAVSHELLSDRYFMPGHLGLKIRQTLFALLTWLGVFSSFIWLTLPYLWPQVLKPFQFNIKKQETSAIKSLGLFFLIAAIVIFTGAVILTIRNNYIYKRQLTQYTLPDERQVNHRALIMEQFYTERFGPREMRESIRYYSVPEEKNLADDTIQNLFKDHGES
ncbi:hypothetical protein FC84_GL001466 [Lapidilactobacillus dextrinicus DSM 20335]|uniref:Uncharacterized protein n=1 Tax=Lapidilactobacillus dextrinicus DSM 20335 TaxID=1423738 RepID=A0A0R2BU80_9LACO|nr:hypothetical protein [Lapidilactobacillus dextrinicus]KRM79292.1 hypothetical protein FC84_GL001466 [Lapidilactobacillus dextrinicus DSM 20335]QFG46871.1 hypothetical protein LH506_05145 [Lapidilactobacillus dextrinicus]